MDLGFAIGIVTGAGVVGSSVSRTIAVDKGDIKSAFFSSILNSITYGASIYFIAKNDWISYAGSMIGSTAICLYMALDKRGNSGDKKRKGLRVSATTKARAKRRS